jgi:tRNA (guanine-N1)-methyltransferase
VIFHVLTIFPEFFEGPFAHGVVKRARDAGIWSDIRIHNLRDWTSDRHKTVDDRPFGGGEGMVLKPEPVFQAVESIWGERRPDQKVVLLSAQGRLFDQGVANRLSREAELLLICGRYEGVDERVAAHLADDEISIGNYVLSGGELAAAVVIDAVARLLPGVLGNEEFRGLRVVSGNGPRRGPAGLPALDAAGRFPWMEGAGSALERQPRGDFVRPFLEYLQPRSGCPLSERAGMTRRKLRLSCISSTSDAAEGEMWELIERLLAGPRPGSKQGCSGWPVLARPLAKA